MIKPITHTPNRLYVDWLTWIIFYFAPHIANMTHNDVIITEICFFQTLSYICSLQKNMPAFWTNTNNKISNSVNVKKWFLPVAFSPIDLWCLFPNPKKSNFSLHVQTIEIPLFLYWHKILYDSVFHLHHLQMSVIWLIVSQKEYVLYSNNQWYPKFKILYPNRPIRTKKSPYKAHKYRLCRDLPFYSNSSRGFYRQLINADISCIFGTSISPNITLFASFSKFLVAN